MYAEIYEYMEKERKLWLLVVTFCLVRNYFHIIIVTISSISKIKDTLTLVIFRAMLGYQ